MAFSKNFVWGVATAAYQIEGAASEDGRGLSVWDSFAHQKGHIADGSTGDIACDHYHRYQDDLALIKNLGVNAYRFSVSWTRLLPSGEGKLNHKGADFYSRLIDGLLERGIEPFMTIHHWDYPLELYHKGGWLNRDMTDRFADFTDTLVKLYGDRVKNYITINEPQVILGCAYDNEEHAPGTRLDTRQQLQVLHHLLLAHGKAARVVHGVKDAKVAIAPNSKIYMPLKETPENIEAARAASLGAEFNSWIWSQNYYMDPIVFGKYPDEYYEKYSDIIPQIGNDDMKIISEPLDFLCQNIYDGRYVYVDETGKVCVADEEIGAPHTDMGWPITPEVLYWGVRFMSERYQLPMFISENGCAMPDLVTPDKKIHDGGRIEYMRRYLCNVMRAENEGLPIMGYFYWSLMDNFEWAHGYKRRFGLTYVDYKTQERILKDSYHFYSEVIRTNGKNL